MCNHIQQQHCTHQDLSMVTYLTVAPRLTFSGVSDGCDISSPGWSIMQVWSEHFDWHRAILRAAQSAESFLNIDLKIIQIVSQ